MLKKFPVPLIIFCMLLTLLLPISTNAAQQQLIIINKASNELAFYENNKLSRVFSVATGKSPSLTPEGNFKIVNKIVKRPYYKEGIAGGDPANPLGKRWLGLNARETWGTTYAIHGNNNPNSIGKYVSLGCVRMHNEEIIWLFDKVEVNTPVIIVHSLLSFDHIAETNGFIITPSTIGSAPAITNSILKLGSNSEEVSTLQKNLKNLGYPSVKMTGLFDEPTKLAVQMLQSDLGIGIDGIVGPETKKALRKLPSQQSSSPTSLENVIVLRNHFKKLGYYFGTSDFTFGNPRWIK